MAENATRITWDRLDALVCPRCPGHLQIGERELRCDDCGVTYPITDGVPGMVDWARLDDAVRRELAGQDEHFADLSDRAVFKPDFHPRHRRVRLTEHLADLLAALAEGLSGKGSVHVACCGTGYEAETLHNAGYEVSASDLSRQALRGLAKRAGARGYRVPYLQADALHLPFAASSFDIAVVVEGLHHTPDPVAGFAELVRVARHRVAVIEPWTGGLFNVLARVGLAHRREYSRSRPVRLSAALLEGMFASGHLQERVRRLYTDPPPGALLDWLGDRPLPAAVLGGLVHGVEYGLRLVGVGNKVLIVADLA